MLGPLLRAGQVAGDHAVGGVGAQVHAPNLDPERPVATRQGLADETAGTGDENRTRHVRRLPFDAGWHGRMAH
ncbi:hypothetical protein D3C81_1647830 [compost metagenome]